MSQQFNYWKKLHDRDELEEFTTNSEGLLWLKIKSIARRELINEFLAGESIILKKTKIVEQFVELFELLSKNIKKSHQILDNFINKKDLEQRKLLDENKLVSELYKMKSFDWGGDYKNALDRYLVDRYIKVYPTFDELNSRLDTEINRAVHGYVFCSWYNHWSSILIENIFKSHRLVLPTVGQIKKVDFFVNNIPFDLKVTYLPENLIVQKRKANGLKPELTLLKQIAKELNIHFDKTQKTSQIYYELVEKIKESKNSKGLKILKEIKKFRLQVLEEIQNNPKILIKNLYEEQGEMRFDASNRLFLVLVDTENFENSWKLKRNMQELKPSIYDYLDSFSNKKLSDLKINFDYKTKGNFTAFSDVIFIVK